MWSFKRNFFKSLIPEENTVVIPNFDHAVFTYQFFDGRDLDTRSRIVLPAEVSMDTNSEAVGYSRMACYPPDGSWSFTVIPTAAYMDWAGDNQGVGFESVYVNIKKIRQDFPSAQNIKVDLRCAWYGVLGNLPVEIKATFYKGGAMTKANFVYTNPTAVQTIVFNTDNKAITARFNDDGGLKLQRLATFNYNIPSGLGVFNLYDTTTPEI